MSRNIVKGGYVVVSPSDYVTIDSNELMKQKLEEIKNRQIEAVMSDEAEEGADGFVEGLDSLQVARLVGDTDEEELASNVIHPIDLGKVTQEAEAEAARIIAEAEKDADNIREKASADGYSAGYNDGVSKGQQEIDDLRAKLESEFELKNRELEEKYSKLCEEIEPALVDKLTSIYEHIVGVELSDSRKTVSYLLQKALGTMDSNKKYIIHVSEEDYQDVSSGLPDISKNSGIIIDNIEVIEDHSLEKNGCMIESDGGIFEVGLDTQMALLSKQLRILSMQSR